MLVQNLNILACFPRSGFCYLRTFTSKNTDPLRKHCARINCNNPEILIVTSHQFVQLLCLGREILNDHCNTVEMLEAKGLSLKLWIRPLSVITVLIKQCVAYRAKRLLQWDWRQFCSILHIKGYLVGSLKVVSLRLYFSLFTSVIPLKLPLFIVLY